MDGIDSDIENPSKLITHLKSIKTEIVKKDISKIGIVFDMDTNSVSERLKMVNNAISHAFFHDHEEQNKIKETISPEIYHISDREIRIACYFTNVEGKGELETVLKKIAKKNAPFADCLTSWKECLDKNDCKINEKEFEKFWVNNYIRFDTCSNSEKKQAHRKCSMSNLDYIFEHKNDVFDLDHPVLNEAKQFLKLFD